MQFGKLSDNSNYLSIHNFQITQFSENSPCTHFPPTFQKLFQNSSVRVPLRLQKFLKSKFFRSFSKSSVYVYSYPKKDFFKSKFFKRKFKQKRVRVPRRTYARKIEQNFRLAFYYISNAHILLRESVLISFLRQSVLTLNDDIFKKLFSRKIFFKSKESSFSKVRKMAGKV